MDNYIPVSYTHLDVYKRQVYVWCVAKMSVAYTFREITLDPTPRVEPVHLLSLLQDGIRSTKDSLHSAV